jgi:hypothetical protein
MVNGVPKTDFSKEDGKFASANEEFEELQTGGGGGFRVPLHKAPGERSDGDVVYETPRDVTDGLGCGEQHKLLLHFLLFFCSLVLCASGNLVLELLCTRRSTAATHQNCPSFLIP